MSFLSLQSVEDHVASKARSVSEYMLIERLSRKEARIYQSAAPQKYVYCNPCHTAKHKRNWIILFQNVCLSFYFSLNYLPPMKMINLSNLLCWLKVPSLVGPKVFCLSRNSHQAKMSVDPPKVRIILFEIRGVSQVASPYWRALAFGQACLVQIRRSSYISIKII